MADQTGDSRERLPVPTDSLSASEAAELGQRVRERREELRLTQEQLAERSGVTRNQIQVIERGWADRAKRKPANPRLATLLGLCEALQMRVRIDTAVSQKVVLELMPLEDRQSRPR